jgi:hypothetical protein
MLDDTPHVAAENYDNNGFLLRELPVMNIE